MKNYSFTIAFLLFVSCISAQVFDTAFWITNGPVNSILKSGNDIILGGDFSYVGKASGHGIPLDTSTGLPKIPNFPKIDGNVYAVAADAWGGWYIGGEFNTVGGIPRKNLARITKTGYVYPTFDPAPNGPVYALNVIPTNLTVGAIPRPNVYVGGNFTMIGGKQRKSIALLNPYNGNVYEGWKPSINGTVYCIERVGRNILMVGGSFSLVDNFQVSNLVKISAWINGGENNTPPHHIYTNFNATVNGVVRAIYFNSQRYSLYIGGSFSTVSNKPRNYLAEIDFSDDTATAWNPNPNGAVTCFAKKDRPISGTSGFGPPDPTGGRIMQYSIENGDTIFDITAFNENPEPQILDTNSVIVGGLFTTIGSVSHKGIAVIDYLTGLPTSWDPNINGIVYSIGYDNYKNLYVGGVFDTVATQSHRNAVKLDSNGMVCSGFNIHFSDAIRVVSIKDSVVYFAGNFICINGIPRKSIAIIDANTGHTTPFSADVNGTIYAMKLKNNILYFGGNFSQVQLTPRNNIASIDINTTQLQPFNPNCNGIIRTMELVNNKLFFAGNFTMVGNSNRANAACSDILTNTTTAWSPTANGTINYIKYYNGIVYAGGYFTQIGTTNRKRLAALDTIAGYAFNYFDTDPNDGVYAFDFYSNYMLAGGWFSSAGGNNRNNLCSADITNGQTSSFNPSPDNIVRSVYVNGNYLFIGGYFDNINSLPRNGFAQIDLTNATLHGFSPSFDYSPFQFLQDGNSLYTVGEFKVIDGDVHAYFAKLDMGYIASTNNEIQNEIAFDIYPNPTNNFLTIVFSKDINLKTQALIYDALGRSINQYTIAISSENNSIDVSNLSAGIYIITININGVNYTKKFIKN